jgi:hypothetical protein
METVDSIVIWYWNGSQNERLSCISLQNDGKILTNNLSF